MHIQLTTTTRAIRVAPVKNTTTISAAAVPAEQTPDAEAAKSPQPSAVALTPAQIGALVCDAFASASSQLHVADAKGKLRSILPSVGDTVINGNVGPKCPQLVDAKTRDAALARTSNKQMAVLEPQESEAWRVVFLPCVGLVEQRDDAELGSQTVTS